MKLISLQIGKPAELNSAVDDGLQPAWVSSIWKTPVAGRVRLNRENLDGNVQADLKNHGGPDKAVCCYAGEHYPDWRDCLGWTESEFPFGAFGENFTLAGMPESLVCIGDVYSIGSAQVQVSQPRMPCWKLGRRWDRPTLPLEVQASGKTGYYLRVLETGAVESGERVTLLDRPLPSWPITRVNHAMYVAKEDAALAEEVSNMPQLAEAWRRPFRRRADLLRYQAGDNPVPSP